MRSPTNMPRLARSILVLPDDEYLSTTLTPSVSPLDTSPHNDALAARDAGRLAELVAISGRVTDAQVKLDAARAQLDARLSNGYEDGIPIVALARVAGISRETAYKAIDRHRSVSTSARTRSHPDWRDFIRDRP